MVWSSMKIRRMSARARLCVYTHTHTHTHIYIYIYIYIKRHFFFLWRHINVGAQAKNKNGKVKYVCSPLSQWPFHIPNSENWTRWRVTSCCSHNPEGVYTIGSIWNMVRGPSIAPVKRWQPYLNSYEELRSNNHSCINISLLLHVSAFLKIHLQAM